MGKVLRTTLPIHSIINAKAIGRVGHKVMVCYGGGLVQSLTLRFQQMLKTQGQTLTQGVDLHDGIISLPDYLWYFFTIPQALVIFMC